MANNIVLNTLMFAHNWFQSRFKASPICLINQINAQYLIHLCTGNLIVISVYNWGPFSNSALITNINCSAGGIFAPIIYSLYYFITICYNYLIIK